MGSSFADQTHTLMGNRLPFWGTEVVGPWEKERALCPAGLYPVLFLGTCWRVAMPRSAERRRARFPWLLELLSICCSQTSGSGGSLRARGRGPMIHQRSVLRRHVQGLRRTQNNIPVCPREAHLRPGWHSRCLCPLLHDSLVSTRQPPRPV